jgi:hypothetical protein
MKFQEKLRIRGGGLELQIYANINNSNLKNLIAEVLGKEIIS